MEVLLNEITTTFIMAILKARHFLMDYIKHGGFISMQFLLKPHGRSTPIIDMLKLKHMNKYL